MAAIIAFFLYWLVFYVVCYIVSEYGQNYLYDEATPGLGWKLAVGTLPLAMLAAWLRPSFDTMFTEQIAWTILQAVAWVAVFTLVLGFHPQHAALLGIATMVLVTGVASMGVDRMTTSQPTVSRPSALTPSKPVRRPASTPPAAPAGKPEADTSGGPDTPAP